MVRQANDPNAYTYDYDLAEHVVVLNDWLDKLFITKLSLNTHDSGDDLPTSILINGRGGDVSVTSQTHSGAKGHRHHHHEHVTPNRQPLFVHYQRTQHQRVNELPRAEFTVAKGRRYRFRMINAGIGFCPLEVSIDRHLLTIIALDGNPIEYLSKLTNIQQLFKRI